MATRPVKKQPVKPAVTQSSSVPFDTSKSILFSNNQGTQQSNPYGIGIVGNVNNPTGEIKMNPYGNFNLQEAMKFRNTSTNSTDSTNSESYSQLLERLRGDLNKDAENNKKFGSWGDYNAIGQGVLGLAGLTANTILGAEQIGLAKKQLQHEKDKWQDQKDQWQKATNNAVDASSSLQGNQSNMQGNEPQTQNTEPLPLERE